MKMMKIENEARKELFEVYSLYLKSGNAPYVSKKARLVYNEYIPAKNLLSEKIMTLVSNLFPIAYPEKESGILVAKVSEIKDFILYLKN